MAIDTRPHPIVIVTWVGTPTVDLVDRYYSWSDACVAAAMAEEQRLIRIHDVTRASCPPAVVCQRGFDHARNDLASAITLAHYAVITNARLRRMLTALRWTSGGRRDPEMEAVDRVETAIEIAIERLLAERIPPPVGLDPDRYEPPRLPTSLI